MKRIWLAIGLENRYGVKTMRVQIFPLPPFRGELQEHGNCLDC